MPSLIYFAMGVVLVAVMMALIWRAASTRYSVPCPAWLAWIVELDNPFLKNNSAREIIPHLHLLGGMKVLDIGCGPGRLTIPIARMIGPAGRVTAFDIQLEMLQRVREKAGREKLSNIDYLQGTAGGGRLNEHEFDCALMVTVLGEIPDKKKAIQEIFRSLKPGGLLSITEVIADPHFQTRKKVVEVASSTGFKEVEFFGNSLSFTINFGKP